jgi:hypothetical protein
VGGEVEVALAVEMVSRCVKRVVREEWRKVKGGRSERAEQFVRVVNGVFERENYECISKCD